MAQVNVELLSHRQREVAGSVRGTAPPAMPPTTAPGIPAIAAPIIWPPPTPINRPRAPTSTPAVSLMSGTSCPFQRIALSVVARRCARARDPPSDCVMMPYTAVPAGVTMRPLTLRSLLSRVSKRVPTASVVESSDVVTTARTSPPW